LNPSIAFLLQLAGKIGSFVVASAGNDYRDASLTKLPSGHESDAAIQSSD
jgi:hypothetical protein